MININNLTLGNFILYKNKKEQISMLSYNEIKTINGTRILREEFNLIEGIYVTEEIWYKLSNNKFDIKLQNTNISYDKNYDNPIMICTKGYSQYFVNKTIKYLHEIQNYYKFITNKELI